MFPRQQARRHSALSLSSRAGRFRAPTFGSPVFIPVRNRASNLFWRDFPAPGRFRSSGKRA